MGVGVRVAIGKGGWGVGTRPRAELVLVFNRLLFQLCYCCTVFN